MSKYPTWQHLSQDHVTSEEAMDGVPDWTLVRDPKTKRWHASGRTSAHWVDKTFASVAEAKAYVEQEAER